MPSAKYAATRTDGTKIGAKVRELVRLMIEDGLSWQIAADSVGIKRSTAYRALHKPHVIAYRRAEKQKLVEMLSSRVPHKLNALMDSDNAAAAVRAALALEDLNNQASANPTRTIQTGGIVIMIGSAQRALEPPTIDAAFDADHSEDALPRCAFSQKQRIVSENQG